MERHHTIYVHSTLVYTFNIMTDIETNYETTIIRRV